ncbi:MAG: ferritin-like domain-containing protein [Pseudomonadota bacterium]|nr:ferritin-like domain-containing protein [Pseudomonadota bacterium]
MPKRVQDALDAWGEGAKVFSLIRDPKVLRSLSPSAIRGLVLKRGKQGPTASMPAQHAALFQWGYHRDQPEMAELYRRAKANQWDSDDMPWQLDVDLEDPTTAVVPVDFLDWDLARSCGIHLDERERGRLLRDFGAWALSQFLHGEQGALYAAAQVTEAVEFYDGKLYGATQVMDEARHVETFSRYLQTKVGKLYPVQDNLYTIIDALMTDGRWDIKFLGMQIMIEGLALGAFGIMYRRTNEPLIREILKNVIRDEARHVHYGVVALREHIKGLTERERNEREDWAFQVAMLMRNRWLAYEIYEEWFVGTISRDKWRQFILNAPGAAEFRALMFSRLIPNLREIGLLTPRIQPAYEKAGLMRFFEGPAANRLGERELLS